jgi:hypothetical protein
MLLEKNLPPGNVPSGKIEGNGEDDYKPGESNEEGKIGIFSDGGHPGAKEPGPCPVPEPGQQSSGPSHDRDAQEPAHRNLLACSAVSMFAVVFPDIFHTHGDEESAEEDEAGQPDVMGYAVVIDIGRDSRLDQLGSQGPPEPCNEGAGGCEKHEGKNPSHEIVFFRICGTVSVRRLPRGDTAP